jgi:hypothetical protein
MQNDCDRLASLADDVARARAERDYAKLSGRGLDSATARLDQSVRDLRALATDAAGKAGRFDHGASLGRTLAYLESTPAGIEPEAWLDRVGERARAAAGEAEQDRIANDSALYHSDLLIRDACHPLRTLSRLALSQLAVTDSLAGLGARLGPAIPLVLFGAGESADRLVPPDTALVANGNRTNLASGLRSALASLGGAPVRAVVLLSDGRQVDADPPSSSVAGGVPVFTVAVAARRLRDVTVSEFSVPSSAFVGQTVNIHAVVRGLGVGGQATIVHFDDGGTSQSRTIKFIDERPMSVDFNWTPHVGGAHRLMLRADDLPGELSLENNRAERWVKVFDRKYRIGIAAGADGPDLRIARAAISQLPWAELSSVSIGSTGAVPWTTEQIGQCDILLLSGLQPNALDKVQWDSVAASVRVHGSSVVLVPDENGALAESTSAFVGLLPFARAGPTRWRVFPGVRGGFSLAPARGVHVLDFGDPTDAFWQGLPPVSRYLPIAPVKPGVRPLLIETESGTPALTEARLGRGRVFCVGTTETWRWRASNAEYPDRFWTQLLRYAAGDSFEARDGGVCLDADPIASVPGKPVKFRVRITAGGADPTSVKLRFHPVGSAGDARLPLVMRPIGSGSYEATVSDLPEDDFDVLADAGPAPGHPRVQLHIHPSSEAEMADLTGDEAWLRRLAESSDGQFFRLDQLAQLPEKLRDLPVDLSHPVELPLWDGPYLFGLVLGCLAVEWGLRKRFGLA